MLIQLPLRSYFSMLLYIALGVLLALGFIIFTNKIITYASNSMIGKNIIMGKRPNELEESNNHFNDWEISWRLRIIESVIVIVFAFISLYIAYRKINYSSSSIYITLATTLLIASGAFNIEHYSASYNAMVLMTSFTIALCDLVTI